MISILDTHLVVIAVSVFNQLSFEKGQPLIELGLEKGSQLYQIL